ncbi:MAG: hypothetical protein K8R25_17860 [Methanosarcinales archaeon]|nr:hypothetical protein [Methanosarcinales archaeon]
MYKVNYIKLVTIIISLIVIVSLISALITLNPASPYNESNDLQFSKVFNTSFHKFPIPLVSYSNSEDYVDSVISSTSLSNYPQNIIGLIKYEESNIIFIESDGIITEIIADDEANVLEIYTLELKPISSKEFYKKGIPMERTIIKLYELEIPLADISNSHSFNVSVLEVSYESWEDIISCKENNNKNVYIEGRFFIDSSDSVVAVGNSNVLTNCILLSITEIKNQSQNGTVGIFSNSVKWESKGLFIKSKSERESYVSVDKNLNIGTWVAEDSWIGLYLI